MADSLRYKHQMVRFAPFKLVNTSSVPTRFVPYCLGEYRQYTRFVPYCLGEYRHHIWMKYARDADNVPVERDFTNIRFMHNNLWDSATVTASSEIDNFEASKTQHRWLTWDWKSDGSLSEQWLKVDLGSAQDVEVLIIMNHWFLSGTTLRIQANGADVWGAPAIDTILELTEADYPIVKFWDVPQSYRWWRIYMDGDWENIKTRGDKDTCPYCHPHYKIGRVFLGTYFSPAMNFSRKRPMLYKESTQKFVSLQGEMQVRKVLRWNEAEFVFDGVTEADMNNFETMFDAVGMSDPLFVCENNKFWWYQTYYVTFKNSFSFERQGIDAYKLAINTRTEN